MLARRQRGAADRRRPSATWRTTRTSGCSATPASTSSSRGPTRSSARSSRSAGMQGPGRELADVARAMREPIKGFGLLSDFAIRKARRRPRPRAADAPPPVARARGAWSSRSTSRSSAAGVDNVLRKHGRDIAEMQYTQKRTADMAIDLYAHRRVHLAHDARHRAARRGGRATRDRPHEHLRRRRRAAARARSSPPSPRTTTSCARPSRREPTPTAATPSTSSDPSRSRSSKRGEPPSRKAARRREGGRRNRKGEQRFRDLRAATDSPRYRANDAISPRTTPSLCAGRL